jgi:ribosomal protein S8
MLVTRKILPILQLLVKLNIVRRFYFLPTVNHFEKKVRVFPFYNKMQTITSNLSLHFRKAHPIAIKLQALKLLNKTIGGSSLILNTSNGLLTHRDALEQGVGGVLIYTVH